MAVEVDKVAFCFYGSFRLYIYIFIANAQLGDETDEDCVRLIAVELNVDNSHGSMGGMGNHYPTCRDV